MRKASHRCSHEPQHPHPQSHHRVQPSHPPVPPTRPTTAVHPPRTCRRRSPDPLRPSRPRPPPGKR
jgi:hypothetical protein